MPPELLPGELLDQFFQCADAAWQRHERVGTLEHQSLSLVHVGRDDHFLNARQRVLAGGEEVGNDACNRAAVIQNRCRYRAHEADRAAAIHKADAVLGKQFSE